MTPTDPLAEFFADTPRAQPDRVFRAAVMERVARRRLRVELALRAVATLLLVVGLALLSPGLQLIAQGIGHGLAEVMFVLVPAGVVAALGRAWLVRRPVLRLF